MRTCIRVAGLVGFCACTAAPCPTFWALTFALLWAGVFAN